MNNALNEPGGSGEGGYPVFTVSDTTGDGAIPVKQLQASETQLRFGNLLTLPTGDGTLLYVEPIYVERTNQEASFPQLNRVLVLYGDRVGYAASLNAALDEALGPDAAPPGGGPAQPPSSAPEPPPTPQPGAQASPELRQAVADITEALQRLQEARASGNFTEAGKALTALQDATRRFNAASEGDTATPSGLTPCRAP